MKKTIETLSMLMVCSGLPLFLTALLTNNFYLFGACFVVPCVGLIADELNN